MQTQPWCLRQFSLTLNAQRSERKIKYGQPSYCPYSNGICTILDDKVDLVVAVINALYLLQQDMEGGSWGAQVIE